MDLSQQRNSDFDKNAAELILFGRLVVFRGISTIEKYLTLNLFLYK